MRRLCRLTKRRSLAVRKRGQRQIQTRDLEIHCEHALPPGDKSCGSKEKEIGSSKDQEMSSLKDKGTGSLKNKGKVFLKESFGTVPLLHMVRGFCSFNSITNDFQQ